MSKQRNKLAIFLGSSLVVTLAVFLALLVVAQDNPVQEKPISILSKGACNVKQPNSLTITNSDGITQLCLYGGDKKPFSWRWSPDGSRLAYVLRASGEPTPCLQWMNCPPALLHFVIDVDGQNNRRFPPANDREHFGFSTDGQYALIEKGCTRVSHTCSTLIYRIENAELVCKYETYEVFFSDINSTCSRLPLKNGEIWDIRDEINKQGCEFYKANRWDSPKCK